MIARGGVVADAYVLRGGETPAAEPTPVPGRVIGLTVTQIAADVLREDGVVMVATRTAFRLLLRRKSTGELVLKSHYEITRLLDYCNSEL